jgi:hypothetical protein
MAVSSEQVLNCALSSVQMCVADCVLVSFPCLETLALTNSNVHNSSIKSSKNDFSFSSTGNDLFWMYMMYRLQIMDIIYAWQYSECQIAKNTWILRCTCVWIAPFQPCYNYVHIKSQALFPYKACNQLTVYIPKSFSFLFPVSSTECTSMLQFSLECWYLAG